METITVRTQAKLRWPLIAAVITLVLVLGVVAGFTYLGNNAGSDLLTQTLSEPLGEVTSAKINIDPGDGNLTVDALNGNEQVLASGTLQYLEKTGLPTHSVTTTGGQADFTLKANGGQSGFRLPWEACNGATDWQIHLNPNVPSTITAHSNGGNVNLNLAGMAVSRIAADTGGGNMNVVLPDGAANLDVTAKTGAGDVTVEIGSGTTGSSTINASSGAGNVVVQVPDGIAARIHTTSGMGKAIVDPQFIKIDDTTYQSTGYNSAANKVEITINSGAGNVSVNTK